MRKEMMMIMITIKSTIFSFIDDSIKTVSTTISTLKTIITPFFENLFEETVKISDSVIIPFIGQHGLLLGRISALLLIFIFRILACIIIDRDAILNLRLALWYKISPIKDMHSDVYMIMLRIYNSLINTNWYTQLIQVLLITPLIIPIIAIIKLNPNLLDLIAITYTNLPFICKCLFYGTIILYFGFLYFSIGIHIEYSLYFIWTIVFILYFILVGEFSEYYNIIFYPRLIIMHGIDPMALDRVRCHMFPVTSSSDALWFNNRGCLRYYYNIGESDLGLLTEQDIIEKELKEKLPALNVWADFWGHNYLGGDLIIKMYENSSKENYVDNLIWQREPSNRDYAFTIPKGKTVHVVARLDPTIPSNTSRMGMENYIQTSFAKKIQFIHDNIIYKDLFMPKKDEWREGNLKYLQKLQLNAINNLLSYNHPLNEIYSIFECTAKLFVDTFKPAHEIPKDHSKLFSESINYWNSVKSSYKKRFEYDDFTMDRGGRQLVSDHITRRCYPPGQTQVRIYPLEGILGELPSNLIFAGQQNSSQVLERVNLLNKLKGLNNIMDEHNLSEISYNCFTDDKFRSIRITRPNIEYYRDLILTAPKYIMVDKVDSGDYYIIDTMKAKSKTAVIKPNIFTREMVRDLLLIASKSYSGSEIYRNQLINSN